ncbi:hypothetical protein HYPSUDRAFT_818823 [Hypholoma sublateritium FD-334 SS-4]|uniref:Uncharacterized protein n=1 Tax=Hypholoma sublateritium (strain FD-334 SS-4) TaxID=945553 RepID=A0A0D2L0M5_HYPSF|nr:hypothetical protein HYPSUDRAFT_818823 [Hypholoma sublateritium FD-334 SS-4]
MNFPRDTHARACAARIRCPIQPYPILSLPASQAPAWGRTHMRRCRLTELERARAASARLLPSKPPPPPCAKPALLASASASAAAPPAAAAHRRRCPRRIRAAHSAGWHADVADAGAALRFSTCQAHARMGLRRRNSTRGRLEGGPPARSGVCARVGVGARALAPLTDCGSQRAKIGRDRTHRPRVAPTARPRVRAWRRWALAAARGRGRRSGQVARDWPSRPGAQAAIARCISIGDRVGQAT